MTTQLNGLGQVSGHLQTQNTAGIIIYHYIVSLNSFIERRSTVTAESLIILRRELMNCRTKGHSADTQKRAPPSSPQRIQECQNVGSEGTKLVSFLVLSWDPGAGS